MTCIKQVIMIHYRKDVIPMIFQLIHNATYKVTFANNTFLVDPAVNVAAYIDDVDYILLTQIHPEHFNPAVIADKTLPVIVKNDQDAQSVSSMGFKKVLIVRDTPLRIDDIITIGKASPMGYLLDNASERPVYLAGDSAWSPELKKQLADHLSELFVVSACEDESASPCPRMNREDLMEAAKNCKHGMVVATHLASVKDQISLKAFSEESGMAAKISVPMDGEIMML